MMRNAIFQAVDKVLQDVLVLPNVLVVDYSFAKLSAGEPVLTFQDILPHSVLRLCVIAAQDLHPSDMHFLRNYPDAYVQVRLGGQEVKTDPCYQTNNPRWDQEFELLLHDVHQCLSLKVLDRNIG